MFFINLKILYLFFYFSRFFFFLIFFLILLISSFYKTFSFFFVVFLDKIAISLFPLIPSLKFNSIRSIFFFFAALTILTSKVRFSSKYCCASDLFTHMWSPQIKTVLGLLHPWKKNRIVIKNIHILYSLSRSPFN